jgi:hypothetical protein
MARRLGHLIVQDSAVERTVKGWIEKYQTGEDVEVFRAPMASSRKNPIFSFHENPTSSLEERV